MSESVVIQTDPLLQRIIAVGERIIAGCERDHSILGAPQWMRAAKQCQRLYDQVRALFNLDAEVAGLEALVARLEESAARPRLT